MAKEKESRCCVCGALVGPGIKYCCYFCKVTNRYDVAKLKKVNKHKASKSTHKSKRKKAK